MFGVGVGVGVGLGFGVGTGVYVGGGVASTEVAKPSSAAAGVGSTVVAKPSSTIGGSTDATSCLETEDGPKFAVGPAFGTGVPALGTGVPEISFRAASMAIADS